MEEKIMDDNSSWGGAGWLILLFLFLFAFNGNGGWGARPNPTTPTEAETKVYSQLSADNAISNSKDIAIAGLQGQLATQQASNQALLQDQATQYQMQQCCSSIQGKITEDGQKTRDLINANKIAELQANNNVLRDALITNQQTQNLISALRPYPTPAYQVSSPYTSIYNYGLGFGNGYFGY